VDLAPDTNLWMEGLGMSLISCFSGRNSPKCLNAVPLDDYAGDLNVLCTSKEQVRSGWRAASGARAMASDGAEGASRREITVAAVLASLSLGTFLRPLVLLV
jgi:hypothetical protein